MPRVHVDTINVAGLTAVPIADVIRLG
jgi:hypothetical protein